MKKIIIFVLLTTLLCSGCGKSVEKKTVKKNPVVTSKQTPAATIKDGKFKFHIKDSIELDDVEIDGHKYEFIVYKEQKDNSVRVLAAGMKGKNLIIPSEIEGKKVVAVGINGINSSVDETNLGDDDYSKVWIAGKRDHKKKLIIPEGVEIISDSSFKNTYFDEVVLPKSLKVIGTLAFTETKIKKVIIKSDDATILDGAFCLSTLKEIIFPPNYHGKMGLYTFDKSGLESFDWPDSNHSVGYENMVNETIPNDGPYLRNCKRLKKIRFPENQKDIQINDYALQGCQSLKKLVFPASTEKVSYGNTFYADNHKKAPEVLVFQGGKTKLVVPKDSCYVDGNGKTRKIITVGKIVAPKNSEALKAAKSMWKIKEFMQDHIDVIEGKEQHGGFEWDDETIEYTKVKIVEY